MINMNIKSTNISFIEKDILETTANLVLQQVNCIGVMGKGLAYQIRQDLSQASYEKYKNLCKTHGEALLGKVLKLSSKSVPNRIYLNIFGQNTIGTESCQTRYDKLEQAFTNIDNAYQNERIAIPYKMSCGLAGGDWNIVLELIKKCFKRNFVEIYRLVSKSDFTTNEMKSDFHMKGDKKDMKNLKNLLVDKETKSPGLELLEELDKEDAYLDNEDNSRNYSAYTVILAQDPRKVSINTELYNELYNFCIKAIRKRLIMILDIEGLINNLVDIAKYTEGFSTNGTDFQNKLLSSQKAKLYKTLTDKSVKEFIKTNTDYTVFGSDENTRNMYISTYQKVLRILTSIRGGESLEYFKSIIHNEEDKLEQLILNNDVELETTAFKENEVVEDSYEAVEDMLLAY